MINHVLESIAAGVKAQLEAQAVQRANDDAAKAIDAEIQLGRSLYEQKQTDANREAFEYGAKIARDAEAVAIEERRCRVQCAEQERPGKVVQFKQSPPSDNEIIATLAEKYRVTTSVACEWIIEIAENLRSAA